MGVKNIALLGYKKRGFGKGHFNGFGGKVDEGESMEESLVRELKEELGVDAKSFTKIGIIDFSFQEVDDLLEVQVFHIDDFSGQIIETEEMKAQWFQVKDVPYDKMWPGDRYWWPLFLEGKKFKANFLFDKPSSSDSVAKIIEKNIYLVNRF